MAIHQYRVIIKAKLWVDTPVEGVETEEGTISHLRIRDGIEVFPVAGINFYIGVFDTDVFKKV